MSSCQSNNMIVLFVRAGCQGMKAVVCVAGQAAWGYHLRHYCSGCTTAYEEHFKQAGVSVSSPSETAAWLNTALPNQSKQHGKNNCIKTLEVRSAKNNSCPKQNTLSLRYSSQTRSIYSLNVPLPQLLLHKFLSTEVLSKAPGQLSY